MKLIQNIKIRSVLLLCVLTVFFGRAWQFLFWDAPYRTLFWDENLLKSLVESILNISWYEYVTSSSTDNFINNLVLGTGFVFFFAAIGSVIYLTKKTKLSKFLVQLGGFNLVFLSFLLMKDKYYQFGQFFEHSIQFSVPFVFLLNVNDEKRDLKNLLKILIAVVFVSHGLYAIGYYPVPGNFQDMVIQIFSFSEENARLFLKFAGVLDFVVALAIFIPKTAKVALVYAVVWGLLTAFARIVANFQIDFFWQTIHQELYGTLYRLSHGLIPLIVLILEGKTKD